MSLNILILIKRVGSNRGLLPRLTSTSTLVLVVLVTLTFETFVLKNLATTPWQQHLQALGRCAYLFCVALVLVIHQGRVRETPASGGASVGMSNYAGLARARRQVQRSSKATDVAHGLRVPRHGTPPPQPDQVSAGWVLVGEGGGLLCDRVGCAGF